MFASDGIDRGKKIGIIISNNLQVEKGCHAMTNATLRGKPDAGNPHVRFDEGEVASAKPRRGSLLYKIKAVLLASVLGGVLPCYVRAADYYFVGASDGSLQEKSNYRIGSTAGDEPTELPGSEDNVFFNTKWGALRTFEVSAADTKFIASRVR